jgi:hypothetical protein
MELAISKNRSNEELVFLFDWGFARRITAAAGTEKIQSNLDSLHEGRCLLHGAEKAAPELRTGVFDRLERAGQNTVRVNELPAQAVGGVGKNAVHFLRLIAGDIDEVGRVRHHIRDTRLRVLKQDLQPGKNRPHPDLQIAQDAVRLFQPAAELQIKSRKNRRLQNDGDGRGGNEDGKPGLHTHPTPPASMRALSSPNFSGQSYCDFDFSRW